MGSPQRLPHVTIPTSHACQMGSPLPCPKKSPCKKKKKKKKSALHWSCVTIPTSCVCLPPQVTLHDHSHLEWAFLPCIHLTCSPLHENNILHLLWKNSPKSHEATPIPSIRYLLRATNKLKKMVDKWYWTTFKSWKLFQVKALKKKKTKDNEKCVNFWKKSAFFWVHYFLKSYSGQ